MARTPIAVNTVSSIDGASTASSCGGSGSLRSGQCLSVSPVVGLFCGSLTFGNGG